jgi:hypothetical protein
MIETFLRNHADPVREAALARLRYHGISTNILTGLAIALGIAAAVLIAAHLYLAALVAIILNRAAAILSGAKRGVAGVSVPDLLIYAMIAFGFAMADPLRALAAAFLLLGLVVLAACAVMFEAPSRIDRGAALISGIVIFAAIAWSCFQPERFSLFAYLFGLLCFPVAGAYAASALVRRT